MSVTCQSSISDTPPHHDSLNQTTSNLSCTDKGVEKNTTWVESCPIVTISQELKLVLMSTAVVLFFFILLANLNMSFYLATSSKKNKSKSNIFIKVIVYTSLLAAGCGLPLAIANLWLERQYIAVDTANFIALFTFGSIMYHAVSLMCIERLYTIVIGNTRKQLPRTQIKLQLVAATILCMVTKVPTVFELLEWSRLRLEKPCEKYKIVWYTIVEITVWMTYCSTIIGTCTGVIVLSIKRHQREVTSSIGWHPIQLKRIRATKWIYIWLSVFWVPYGVFNILAIFFSKLQFEVSAQCSHNLAYCSFLAVPIIYYFMDKQYARYVQQSFSCCSKQKKLHCHPKQKYLNRSNANPTNIDSN